MVVSIVALLVGILLPALSQARDAARGSRSLSNLRQLGHGLAAYAADHGGTYPMHSSLKSLTTALGLPRTRWPDYIYPYMNNTAVYLSPNLTAREVQDFSKVFAHTANQPTPTTYGGYGYNFQYLGNSRQQTGNTGPFHAQDGRDVVKPAATVSVGDTAGSRKGDPSNEPGAGGAAVYVLDPPLGSVQLGSHGSRNGSAMPGPANAYYEGGSDETGPNYLTRAFPAQRNTGLANIGFLDGHVQALLMSQVDDSDGDGTTDNGWWNGRGDANVR